MKGLLIQEQSERLEEDIVDIYGEDQTGRALLENSVGDKEHNTVDIYEKQLQDVGIGVT